MFVKSNRRVLIEKADDFEDEIDERRKYSLDKFQYGITKDTFNSF